MENSIAEPFKTFGLNSAEDLMKEAIARVDSHMGSGYAKEHPELLGAFMLASAQLASGLLTSKLATQSRR